MTAESFQGQLVLTWKGPCSNQGSEGREQDVPGVAGPVKREASGKRRVFRPVFSNLSCSSKAFISRPRTSCSSMVCNMCVKRCNLSALELYIIPNGLLGVTSRSVMRLTCKDVPSPSSICITAASNWELIGFWAHLWGCSLISRPEPHSGGREVNGGIG